MGQRNALGLCGDDVVVLRGLLQQLPGAGHGELLIAEDHKAGNGKGIVDRADGQLPLQACHIHGIVHGKTLLLFYFQFYYTLRPKNVKGLQIPSFPCLFSKTGL